MVERNKELIGIIQDRKLDRVRNKKSEYLGNTYYRLTVDLENKPELKEILVFKKFLQRADIYQQLERWETRDYIGKRYLFKVQRKPGAGQIFRLIDWEILKSNGKKN